MGNITFLVAKEDGKTYDMSELVQTITWSGRKGAAARTLSVTLLDDPKRVRPEIDCEKGHQCAFYWKSVELFRGIIMRQAPSGKSLTITANDIGIYLSNNKDSFNYTNKTASYIFTDCMNRFELAVGSVADTLYQIPELPKPKTTIWDVLCDALSQTYKATGERFYISVDKNLISLTKRTENTLKWVVETGQNLIDYSYSKSIEKTKTRIKLLTKEGSVLVEKSNSELERKIGIFQDIETPDDDLNAAQLQEMAANLILEKSLPEENLNITGLGIPDVISGKCVYVYIKDLNIARVFFVDEDSHTFTGKIHKMSLKLNFSNDIANIE